VANIADYKQPKSVLIVIATQAQEKEILCLLRSDDPCFWQSVTGSLQPGELPQVAAQRELFEETGLQLHQGKLVDCQHTTLFEIYPQFLHRYAPGVTQNLEHTFCFFLESKIKVSLSKEHTKYCWLSKAEAIKIMKSPSNVWAINEFIQ
jgi:dATP pyrophosphohydrolase